MKPSTVLWRLACYARRGENAVGRAWHTVRFYLGRSCGHVNHNTPGVPQGERCELKPRHHGPHASRVAAPLGYTWSAHPAGSQRR